MTEEQYQAQCALWLRNHRPELRGRFRRVKNEGSKFGTTDRMRMIQGAKDKATGIVKGTWDAFFICEPILWVEFKVGSNGLTKEQIEFKMLGIDVGWDFRIAKNTLDNFKIIVYEFFGE